MNTTLDSNTIEERLKSLPGWHVQGNALERLYIGKSYLDALEKLNTIAQLAEAADHHPDLILSWKKLTIRYWTHTADGITDLDFEMARKVEATISS